MIVVVVRLSLHISHSHSLKEKRAIVRKVVDRTMARFKLFMTEVDGQDTWQRAVLGFAVVGSDGGRAEALAQDVVRATEGMLMGEAEVIAVDRDLLHYGETAFGHRRPLGGGEGGEGVVDSGDGAAPRTEVTDGDTRGE